MSNSIVCKPHGLVDCPHCAAARAATGKPACCSGCAPIRVHDSAHDHCQGDGYGEDEGFSWTWRIIVPGVILAIGLVGEDWIGAAISPYFYYAMMGAAYLLCGLPVLREAGEAVLRRDFFNEFTLMGLASLIAMALGEVTEGVGVMVFYSLGEAAQEKAAGDSRRSIQALIASKPEKAVVLENGAALEVPPEQVTVGSRILVKPGEKVPLDGIVLKGSAAMNMSSLTGESLPIPVAKGDKVFSGSISVDGDLELETVAEYSDSMVGKILAMVENAVESKSKTERFITVFARYYTPIVVLAAVLVATLPPLLLGLPWNVWVYRALVMLVVSCPCALVLSVPLAFFGGIGAASRHGLLVKGGQVFDALAKAREVVFDKTGTLTRGKLRLVSANPVAGVTEEALVRVAALAESRSTHPVAAALVEAAGDVPAGEVTIRNVAGKGIVADSAEGEILVGNAALLRDAGLEVDEPDSNALVAHVAVNGRYHGCLLLADALKDDSKQAIGELRRIGVEKLYMLTGDREAAAAEVAGELGLDGYRAGLLPDGKVSAFRELSPQGRAVFVGDGVNDAPVLASAGVGVAMGALGSAAAVEAADAVILDDSPTRLPLLFRLAGKTRRVAGENIAFALGVKILFIALGVAGVSGLWEAVFADVGVALLAVLNSMRMTRM